MLKISNIAHMIRNIPGAFSRGRDERIGRICKVLRLGMHRNSLNWRWQRKFFSFFYFDMQKELNPHIAIFGESGSGKSNACKMMLRSAKRSSRIIVFDPHNEYVGSATDLGAEVYDASRFSINIFSLDGSSEKERTAELTGMFKRVMHLGEVQSSILQKCISYSYKRSRIYGAMPTMKDLLFMIRVFKKHASKSEMKTLLSLENRFSALDIGTFSSDSSIDSVLARNSIFAMSNIRTLEAQQIYMENFLKKMYARMLGMERESGQRIYIVIDEAERLGDNSVIERLASEGRKYGIGIISISQRAKEMPKSIRNNTSMFMAFYQREPEELNYISNMIACGTEYNRFSEVRKNIRNLKRGSAIVVSSRLREPAEVRFDAFSETDSYIGYDISEFCRIPKKKEEVFAHFAKKGFDGSKVSRELSSLIKKGKLSYYLMKTGPHSGIWYISMHRNSAEHDVSVFIASKILSSCGINNVIYNSSYGPDIIAYSKGTKIAVEYETGKNDISSARRMLSSREAKYNKIMVIVNDFHYKEYKNEFGNSCEVIRASEFFSANQASADP